MQRGMLKGTNLAVGILVAGVGAYLFWRQAWFADDALITLHQVQVFVAGEGIVYNPGVRVQAFTHPAWFFVTSAVHWMTGQLYLPILLVSVWLGAAALFVLHRFASTRPGTGRTPWIAAAVATAPLLSLGVRDFTASGLETPLSLFLSALAAGMLLRGVSGSVRLWLCLALLVLTRPDHALLFGPAAALLLHREVRSWDAAALLPGAFLFFGWGAFAFFYFGSPLPNTYYAKAASGMPQDAMVLQGLLYLFDALVREGVALTLVLFAGVIGWRRGGMARALAVGLGLTLLYLVWIGGDFMRGRLLAAPCLVAAFLVADGIGSAWRARRLLIPVLTLPTAAAILTGALFDPVFFNVGVERRVWAPLFGWHSPHRSLPPPKTGDFSQRRVAEVWVRCGGMGWMRMYAPADIHIVDACGLADPFVARLPAMVDFPLKIAHFERRLPANHPDLVLGRDRVPAHAGSAALYRRISLVTTAPLFDPDRIAALFSKPATLDDAAREAYRTGAAPSVVLPKVFDPFYCAEAVCVRAPKLPEFRDAPDG